MTDETKTALPFSETGHRWATRTTYTKRCNNCGAMFNDFQNWLGSKGESYRERCRSAPEATSELGEASSGKGVVPEE